MVMMIMMMTVVTSTSNTAVLPPPPPPSSSPSSPSHANISDSTWHSCMTLSAQSKRWKQHPRNHLPFSLKSLSASPHPTSLRRRI
eukprot:6198124-Pleurochrysis_carterae.AAC.5